MVYHSNKFNQEDLPSTKKLLVSTLLALIVAIVLLFTLVLPAEYGMDPTGIGQMLGLKKMGEIRVSLEEELKAEQSLTKLKPEPASVQSQKAKTNKIQDELTITLEPNAAAELKAKMKKGQSLEYTWDTNVGKVNFDIHGDSEKLKIKYHRYERGSTKIKTGSIKAAFDGSHGWFWRNRSGKKLNITIQISGKYQGLERIK